MYNSESICIWKCVCIRSRSTFGRKHWEESSRQNSRSGVRLVVQRCVVPCGDSLRRSECYSSPVHGNCLFRKHTAPTAASCQRTIIRFGFASFPFTAWFVGSSRPTLRRSRRRKRRNNGSERAREREREEGKSVGESETRRETGRKERHDQSEQSSSSTCHWQPSVSPLQSLEFSCPSCMSFIAS